MAGQSNHRSGLTAAWSYQTMIRQTLPDGLSIGNITKYSVTTSKHQTMERVFSCNILIASVPIGTRDLEEIATDRGLLSRLETEVKRAVLEGQKN